MRHCKFVKGLLLTTQAQVAVEIGCARGDTSRYLLNLFPRLVLYMVDPWKRYSEYRDVSWNPEAIYRHAMRNTQFAADRRRVLRMESTMALKLGIEADLVFIDGNHSYRYVAMDMAWWERIVPGGIFCGHDYCQEFPGVVRAVDEWEMKMGIEVHREIVRMWWARKS